MPLASMSSAAVASAAIASSAAAVSSGGTSLNPAIFGLCGAVIGGLIVTGKDLWLNTSKNKADRVYLSIRVGAELGRYIHGCYAVAMDDGTPNDPWYQYSGEECKPQVKTPEFNPLELKVEWKVLPAQLLYDILDIPHEADRIETSIAHEFMMDDDVPEHREFFWRRRELWAQMGLRVCEISDRLRPQTGLPSPRRPDGEWNLKVGLQAAINEVVEKRKAYEAQVSARRAKECSKLE